MLRGTCDDHARFLLGWFTNLDAALQARVARDGVRPVGRDVIEVRGPQRADGSRRLLALIELDGLSARTTWVEIGYEGLVRTALARLQETLGGKP